MTARRVTYKKIAYNIVIWILCSYTVKQAFLYQIKK